MLGEVLVPALLGRRQFFLPLYTDVNLLHIVLHVTEVMFFFFFILQFG